MPTRPYCIPLSSFKIDSRGQLLALPWAWKMGKNGVLMGKLSSPKVASVLNIHYLKIKMPLLDFKLLLWIKQMLKSISEKRFAQCLTSASLWELWLSLLTHSVEKWTIEWFEFEGKMSHILPVWFFLHLWRFRQSLLPLRRSRVS